ncbi:MAG: helicase-exonuclease AddAB subunit AddA [Defluviitaleaceae bacterium]|nr:helicase-exonuclease AddAB subunit AddA [Defluviitaleaceae bacterium]
MNKFTEDQQRAINSLDREILVSAAAGSGKTSVLVERIIKKITSENPIDIDKILVVTFTNAAASEMKTRITKALSKKIQNKNLTKSQTYNLKRQLFLLKNANIKTIHSFCADVVRESFHILNIDPNFKIFDESNSKLLEQKVLTETFEKYYTNLDEDFFNLIEMYSGKLTDDELKNQVLKLYKASLCNIYPEKWLEEQASMFKGDDNHLKDIIYSKIESRFKAILNALDDCIKICKKPYGPHPYEKTLNQDMEMINSALLSLQEYKDLDKVKDILNIGFVKLATITKKFRTENNLDDNLQDSVKHIRDSIKKSIKNILNEFLFKEQREMVKDIFLLYPSIQSLVSLTLDFYENFKNTKLEKNVLDYEDLQHFAAQALHYNEIQSKFLFEEIFVDEYQDSDYIQEFILSSVCKNRFMVGDIKQSIYSFRGAVPDIFMEKSSILNFIPLSKNFRSRMGIIDGINFLFEKLLPPTKIIYDDRAKLFFGADYKKDYENIDIHLIGDPTKDKNIEIENIDEEDDFLEVNKIELQANLIALEIKKIKKEWQQKGKDLNFSDIAILSRTKGIHSKIISELKKHNIPSKSEGTVGFFESTEIKILVSYLNIIDNPLQDIHLIAVLKSPIYDINEDNLISIKKDDRNLFFFKLQNYLEYGDNENLKLKISEFLDDLQIFRNECYALETEALINLILEKTNYLNYVAAISGKTGLDNINILIDISKQYTYKDLHSFILYVQTLIKRKIDLSEASSSTEEIGVNIMTIHKSKGLEFPIVFLVNLSGKFNKIDLKSKFLIHRKYGFGPKLIDEKNRLISKNIIYNTVKSAIKDDSIAEEIRILYVACTRAKERLIFVSMIDDIQKKKIKWSFINEEKIFNTDNYLDLIMSCITVESNNINQDYENDNFNVKGFNIVYHENINKSFKSKEENTKKSIFDIVNNFDSNTFDESIVENQIIEIHENKVKVPTSISITEIKKNKDILADNNYNYFENNKVDTLKVPNFILKNEKLTSIQIGNAYHTVLENISFNKNDYFNFYEIKNSYTEDIKKFLNYLTNENHLNNQEKNVIDINIIETFLKSDIANKMRLSKYIKKETSFAMSISPKEAYLSDDTEKKIIVHGIIDCYFEYENELIILDYKTDKFKSKQDIIEKYEVQMKIYKKALEEITKRHISKIIIYMIKKNLEIIL